MSPTHGNEEIEGRYKERVGYTYSAIPTSTSSPVYDTATLEKQPAVNGHRDTTNNGVQDNNLRVRSEMSEKGSTLLQYVAAAAANLCCVAAGAMLGWTSPVLPKLGKTLEDNPLGTIITEEESSWVASLVAIGAMIGSFIAGYLAERVGRKRTLLAAVVPFLLGWALIASAKDVVQLYVARIILGLALAFAFTVVPMYCGEIAETSVRGALGSFLQLFVTVGLLYAYAVGPYVSYLVFWILCAIPAVIFFAVFITMPESPYYLLKIGEREQAVAALARLRSKSPASVQKEVDEMQAEVEEAFRNEASVLDLFTDKANFRAMIYTSLLASFQQLSGINFVLFYMETIFISARTPLSTAVATIIVGCVQLIASSVTPVVVDRLGRKMLLIFSGIGEIVTLGALGIYFYLQDAMKSDVSSIAILPVLSLVIFIATYSVGWGPLPWTVMGEMFQSNVKSKASGITVCACWFLAFIITKFSSNLKTSFGSYTLYWVFGAFCVCSVVFTVLVLPETKGKSLQQIRRELTGENPEIPELDGGVKK